MTIEKAPGQPSCFGPWQRCQKLATFETRPGLAGKFGSAQGCQKVATLPPGVWDRVTNPPNGFDGNYLG
jgi:hypothetical protein